MRLFPKVSAITLGVDWTLGYVRFAKIKVGVISFRKFGQYLGRRFDRVQIRQCVCVCVCECLLREVGSLSVQRFEGFSQYLACRFDHVCTSVRFAELKVEAIRFASLTHYLGSRFDHMCVCVREMRGADT